MGSADYLDARLAKALSHPLRPQILQILTTRGEASPVQIAEELGASLGVVSYHVRILRDHGCVELVHTRPRRGAVEHYYRALLTPVIDDSQWERLPLVVRRQLADQTIGQVVRAAARAATRGGFDRPGVHVDRVPLKLDEQGWREISALLTRTLDAVADIQAKSDQRARDSNGDEASELALLHYSVDT